MLQYDLFEDDPSVDYSDQIFRLRTRYYIIINGKRLFLPSYSACAEYLAERDNGND